MYVASSSDKDWLLNVQRGLHKRSCLDPVYVFCKLWGFISDPRNLRNALARVAQNKGKRTAGVDRMTVRNLLDRMGSDCFIEELRMVLRNGTYTPSPVRRVMIPKAGQPGKFRPLGIPTVRDRVVQSALKNILEPIFEADFYPTSFGFRPGRCAHGALEYMKSLLRPSKLSAERQPGYQWAIEGDIKACFDNIDHHSMMNRLRRRVSDNKVLRLVLAFLRSGVLSAGQFSRTDSGTPQGGILSPLLANIALSAIEERYERHAWPRREVSLPTDKAAVAQKASQNRRKDLYHGRCVLMPIRYADDFIIFVGAPQGPLRFEAAEAAARTEKAHIATVLREELSLELSEAKTKVTPVTRPLRFLGHHIRVRAHPAHGKLVSAVVIPKDRSHLLRERIKRLFGRSTLRDTLANRLKLLNLVLRGWCYFYRHAWGASRIFSGTDHYVWWTIFRWLRKKHPTTSMRELRKRYGWYIPGRGGLYWQDGKTRPFQASRVSVKPFRMAWMKPPRFATADGEPGA